MLIYVNCLSSRIMSSCHTVAVCMHLHICAPAVPVCVATLSCSCIIPTHMCVSPTCEDADHTGCELGIMVCAVLAGRLYMYRGVTCMSTHTVCGGM